MTGPINYRKPTPLEIEAEKTAWTGSARAMGKAFDHQFERHATRPIHSIIVGERHPKDFGDIDALAKSIADVGLLHPVVIKPDGTLIAGGRRIMAAQKLGWTEVPVTVIDLDKIVHGEFAENMQRKDFTTTEAAAIKRALEPLEKTKAKERQRAGGHQGGKASGKLPTASKGRAADKAAAVTGKKRRTLEKAEAVMKTAEAEPACYGDLAERLDEDGASVDPIYREMRQRQKPAEPDPKPTSARTPASAPDDATPLPEPAPAHDPAASDLSDEEKKEAEFKVWLDAGDKAQKASAHCLDEFTASCRAYLPKITEESHREKARALINKLISKTPAKPHVEDHGAATPQDVGPYSRAETDRLRAHVDELSTANRRLQIENVGLKNEVSELKQRIGELENAGGDLSIPNQASRVRS